MDNRVSHEIRTAALARDIAEEETATAYDALSEEILDLREEIAGLRREILALRRGVIEELERLRGGWDDKAIPWR